MEKVIFEGKVYLDTCIISGLANEDLANKEQESLIKLLKLYKKGKLTLVTSPLVMEEISKIPIQFRAKHEAIYLLLEDVPITKPKYLSGIIGTGIIPFEIENPLYKKLKDILPDENDRHHVFHALNSNCAYFITTDRKTILRHNHRLFKEFNELMVMSPSEIIELLNTAL